MKDHLFLLDRKALTPLKRILRPTNVEALVGLEFPVLILTKQETRSKARMDGYAQKRCQSPPRVVASVASAVSKDNHRTRAKPIDACSTCRGCRDLSAPRGGISTRPSSKAKEVSPQPGAHTDTH